MPWKISGRSWPSSSCAATPETTTPAALLLCEIEGYLQMWGHHRTLVGLHARIHGHIINPLLTAVHLAGLGLCHWYLGDYVQAIELHTQALALARDTGNSHFQGSWLANLGNCHLNLGDYVQAIELHTQALAIVRDTGNPYLESSGLNNLGICHYRLGDYRQAIEVLTQARAIARDNGDSRLETIVLGNLAVCHRLLGDYRQAIDLHTQGLTIVRDVGDRYAEANGLDYLGRAWLAAGDAHRAVALLEEAVNVAGMTGDNEPAATARSALARAHLELGDPQWTRRDGRGAQACVPARGAVPLEGLALLGLHRTGEAVRAFSDALATSDALLALADKNVAALQVRALALSGLAAAVGDPVRAAQAIEAFALTPNITSAPGVAADTLGLLKAIASHDRSGVLTEVCAAQNL